MWEGSRDARKAAAEVGGSQETEAKSGKGLGLKGTNRSQEQDTDRGRNWREAKGRLFGGVRAPELPTAVPHPTLAGREKLLPGKV